MNRSEPTSVEGPRERRGLSRDALVIVLTGIVLGLAFNHVQRSNRPPRGLPWIAASRALESVNPLPGPAEGPTTGQETRAPAKSGGVAATKVSDPREPAAAVRPPSAAQVGPESTVSPAVPDPATGLDEDLERAAHGAPGTAEGRSGVHSRLPNGGALRGLPVIPEVDRPLAVEFRTVARFIEAGAALLVDARERAAFAEGHIPGAMSVPYDEALGDRARLEEVDPGGRPIIVYCSGGTCEASRRLAELLVSELGRRRVLVYEGGFGEWAAAGMPVTKEIE